MATISENLKTIKDSTMAIKQAIIDKGGEVGDLTTYASAIANLPSGGGGGDVNPTASKNDVTFYDYDGTIRYSYTSEEFLALTEMPPLPTQKGLICQEWNWSFEDAKEYVTEYGILDVGATYITDDGKTRLYIRIAAEGRMDVPLYFQQTKTNGVVIDWGDGSATQTFNDTGYVNTTHHYSSVGDYIISLDVADGCTLGLGHDSSSYGILGSSAVSNRHCTNMLQRIEIGRGVEVLNRFAFIYCYSLSFIAIPNSVTSINSGAFYHCHSLTAIVFPYRAQVVNSTLFAYCYALVSVVIPNGVTDISSSAFVEDAALASICLPAALTSINSSAFAYCYALTSVTIPASCKTISDGLFTSCFGMAFYDFSRHTTVPTLANANAFTDIPSDCKIIVPDALYDEWIAATNWSTYASHIIKKTDWNNR